jgi:serine/threonine protein phosphatase PrpC
VKVRPKEVDMRALKLSAEEGFVLSRLDGPMELAELVSMSGIEEERLTPILMRLAAQGVIDVEGAPPPQAPASTRQPKPVPKQGKPAGGGKVAPAKVAKPVKPGPPAPLELDAMPELLGAGAPASARPPSIPKAPPVPRGPGLPPPGAPKRPSILPKPPGANALPGAPRAPSPPPPQRAKMESFSGFGVVAIPGLGGDVDDVPPDTRSTPEPDDSPEPETIQSVAPRAPLAPFASPSTLVLAGLTDVGSVRSNNEDAFGVVDVTQASMLDVTREGTVTVGERGVLLLVSDGMGGANAGEVASAIVVETVCKRVVDSPVADPAAALAESVELSNTRVIEAAREPGRAGMGATVVAVLLLGNEAITAEVGDSRVYLVRGGVATLISKDQTYVQLLLDQGILTPETVATSRAKNVVLQAVGKADSVTVAQRRIALRNEDIFLLCSDGLTAYVNEAEIAATLTPPLDAACKQLITMSNERGGKDNITVIAARVSGELAAPGAGDAIAGTITSIREATLAPGGG